MFARQVIPARAEHMSEGRWVGEGQSNGKPLESDMVCFTLLKCYSGDFVRRAIRGQEQKKGDEIEHNRCFQAHSVMSSYSEPSKRISTLPVFPH